MSGLVMYLAGPGRANEHTNPHVVTGDLGVRAFHASGQELDRDEALGLARYLDQPHRAFEAGETGNVKTQTRTHVWQCALALRPGEGELDDAAWADIASKFMVEVFGAEQVDQMRWAAIRHGLSANGNDHIHLAVNLVRTDGEWVDDYRDYARARDACRVLEVEVDDLLPLVPNEYELAHTAARVGWARGRAEEVAAGDPGARIPWAELDADGQAAMVAAEFASDDDFRRAWQHRNTRPSRSTRTKGYVYGEREAAGRRLAQQYWHDQVEAGKASGTWEDLEPRVRQQLTARFTPAEQPRAKLARAVRAAATEARSEAEFVRAVRRGGDVLIRPRFGAGGRDEVVGYSVGLRTPGGPIWYGGYRLSDDLSLTGLRERWGAAGDQTPAEALTEWRSTRHQSPKPAGLESMWGSTRPITPAEWRKVTADLQAAREQLRGVDGADARAWAAVSRDVSGALATWSRHDPQYQAQLARAAQLAAAGSAVRGRPPAKRPVMPSIAATCYLLSAAGSSSPGAKLAVLTALLNLMKAASDALQGRGDIYAARGVEIAVRHELMGVRKRLATASKLHDGVTAATARVAPRSPVDRRRGREGRE